MKKLLVGLFLFIAATSQASYLYWQVNEADFNDAYSAGDATATTLYAYNGSSAQALQAGEVGQVAAYDLGTGNWSGYSFYVEVANYVDSTLNTVATSEPNMVAYSELGTSIQAELSAVPQVQVWHGGAFVAPEPTSAVLLLFGLAYLGLKRREV